jgi:hypothetical protein
MKFQELESATPANFYYDVRSQLSRFVHKRSDEAFAAGDAARDALKDKASVEARQCAIREHFIKSIGGLPSMETPVNVKVAGEVKGDGFRIEKLIYESRPKNYVTANLYLPENIKGRTGAVLFVCGHAQPAKQYDQYQFVAQSLVLAGLVVLVQDPIGQGERLTYWDANEKKQLVEWGCAEHDHAGLQCLPLGESMARYFLHDSMRSIDVLIGRPEVDAARIGVTGNSGGGTQTSMVMLADTRIAAAAPATFIMNRQTYMYAGGAQDAEQIWPGFSAAGYDHEDILLAMAPKPVRALAVTSDFFPIEGTRRTVQRCKRVWAIYGKESNVDLVEDDYIHAYTKPLARAATQFFAWHLLGGEYKIDETKIVQRQPEVINCTKSGQVVGEIPDAQSVFEANQVRLQELQKERNAGGSEALKRAAKTWLKSRVFSQRKTHDLNPRYYHECAVEGLNLTATLCMWWAQDGLLNHGVLLRDSAAKGQKLPLTIAVWDGGSTQLVKHQSWIQATCKTGRAVLVLNVTGAGTLKPNATNMAEVEAPWATLHKIETDLMFLDDDLAAIRTYDVTRALDLAAIAPNIDASKINVYCHGPQGLYGRLAAFIDERIQSVENVEGLKSYSEWVSRRLYDNKGLYPLIIRGMLQHFDLPEIESLT